MKRVILFLFIVIGLIFANGCYWLFSDIQTQCIKKIESNRPISFYEKASILTLHAGICTVGAFYCKEAAYANFKMLITDEDTVYMHSENWITPKIKARFKNRELGRI